MLNEFKPVQCSECGSRNIVNPINEIRVVLRCLNCGHEKRGKTLIEESMSNIGWRGAHKPYHEF